MVGTRGLLKAGYTLVLGKFGGFFGQIQCLGLRKVVLGDFWSKKDDFLGEKGKLGGVGVKSEKSEKK